jgi:hypothetical protein
VVAVTITVSLPSSAEVSARTATTFDPEIASQSVAAICAVDTGTGCIKPVVPVKQQRIVDGVHKGTRARRAVPS